MTETVLALSRLTDAAVGEDGESVQFGIESQDGCKVEISCDHRDIESVIHYMIQLGRNAAARRGQVTPHQFGNTDRVEASPLEVSDIGLMKDIESSDGVLVARMSGFDMGFKVTPFQLRALHAEIERILPDSVLHPKDHHHHHDHDHER